MALQLSTEGVEPDWSVSSFGLGCGDVDGGCGLGNRGRGRRTVGGLGGDGIGRGHVSRAVVVADQGFGWDVRGLGGHVSRLGGRQVSRLRRNVDRLSGRRRRRSVGGGVGLFVGGRVVGLGHALVADVGDESGVAAHLKKESVGSGFCT